MYAIVRDFRRRTHKPVVAATQEVAASGAYYIICGADRIVAHPTSIVGSIGVIFNSFDFEGTMGKLGVVNNAVKSGSLKDMGSPYKALADHERSVMQEMVDEYFTRFQKLVRDSRPVKEEPLEDLKAYRDLKYAGIFSGRVFSGEEAVQKGLADQTGQLDDAIAAAEKLAGVKGSRVVMYKRPYGYGGSIYASGQAPTPRADVLRLELPGARELLPTGFYYLWQP
jgi:protease-4